MIRKGFYFSSKTEKNKGDRDFNNNCNSRNPLFSTSPLQNLPILRIFLKFNIEILLPMISRSARIMQLTCRCNVVFCFGRLSDVSAVKIQIYPFLFLQD